MASRRRASRARRRSGPRVLLALRATPAKLQLVAGLVLCVGLWAAVNWIYHAVHKPTELLFPVSNALNKTPSETWREYESHFRRYATPVVAPELLAAIAQVESSGNPIARTYWKWHVTWRPFELYRPASSALGMYQITDAKYAQTKRLCLDEPGGGGDFVYAPSLCWFDGVYTRVVPSQAVDLAATLLDRDVAAALKRQRVKAATLQHKQDLAAVIHLCGAGAGEAYARRGFQLTQGQRCGDHDVRVYLQRVNGMKRLFVQLARNS
jgi:hypothetical protein